MSNEKIYNFMFATNAKFGCRLPLVLCSIFDNTKEKCRVYIFYSELKEKDKNNIIKAAQRFNQEVVLEPYNIKEVLNSCNLEQAKPWFGSYDAYTRIFAAEDLYKKGISKCIYLDCDVLIVKDLQPLFKIYDEMETIGGSAGREPYSTNPFMTDNYVNSGVLVMNLNYLHQNNFTARCVEFLHKYAGQSRFMDQDAINHSVNPSDIVNIGGVYNMLAKTKESADRAVILHYAGIKPWSFWRKWNHAKYIYYKLRLYYWLKVNKLPCSRKACDVMFAFIEIITWPLAGLLNAGHDLNFKRRMRRKARRSRKNV